MFVLGVEVTYSLAPRVLPRVHAAVVRECNRRAMQRHARENIPRHFETGAGSRYHYEQRRSTINLAFLYRTDRAAYDRVTKLISKNVVRAGEAAGRGATGVRGTINRGFYSQVKAVLGLKPLVWSGQLQTAVMMSASNPKSITATQNRSRLTLKTPPWATSRIKDRKGRTGGQMQQEALRRSAELQAITPGELRSIRAGFKHDYIDIMNDPANPRHTFLSGFGGNVLRQRKRFGKG